MDYRGSLRRRAVALSTTACAISLASMIFTAVGVAQTPQGPIVGGRQLQPTQQQLQGTKDQNTVKSDRWNRHWIRWNNRV
jgi:hypothetical protein